MDTRLARPRDRLRRHRLGLARRRTAIQFLSGYLVERSLSLDNVFVFAIILAYFAVPSPYRHRALLWGVLGALVLRATFIAVGAVALERFSWTVYVLGIFLIATGMRLAVHEVEAHPVGVVLRLLRRIVPMTKRFHEQRFFVRIAGRRLATPMLAVFVAVATTDVVFAVDSVPAIFAVTEDPSSSLPPTRSRCSGCSRSTSCSRECSIVSRCFVHALAAILVFAGAKMAASDLYDIPVAVSVTVIGSVLGGVTIASLLQERRASGTAAARAASLGRPTRLGPGSGAQVRAAPGRYAEIAAGSRGKARPSRAARVREPDRSRARRSA